MPAHPELISVLWQHVCAQWQLGTLNHIIKPTAKSAVDFHSFGGSVKIFCKNYGAFDFFTAAYHRRYKFNIEY